MREDLITDAIQRQWPDRIIALKELLAQRFDYLERVMDERQAATKMALDLGAREMARRLEFLEQIIDMLKIEMYRRLDLLNGEAGRLTSMQATYLPREVHAQHHSELSKAIAELGRNAATVQGRGQVIAIVVSSVISVIVGLLFIVVTRVLH